MVVQERSRGRRAPTPLVLASSLALVLGAGVVSAEDRVVEDKVQIEEYRSTMDPDVPPVIEKRTTIETTIPQRHVAKQRHTTQHTTVKRARPQTVERRTRVERSEPVVEERTIVEKVIPPPVVERRTTVETVPVPPMVEERTVETIEGD